MLLAAAIGALAASALLVGALLAYAMRPAPRVTAAVMALGSGLLIGSVAYDLVADAQLRIGVPAIALSLLAGAGVFVGGSRLIERHGAARRKRPTGVGDADRPLAIVLGSVLDGVPESLVLGLSVLHGETGWALLAGVVLSNLPEGLAASGGLRAGGWRLRRVLLMWSAVVLASAVAAGLGPALFAGDDGTLTGVALTFAAGALLAMVADTMIPEAYEVERSWTGGLVVAGFAASLLIGAALA